MIVWAWAGTALQILGALGLADRFMRPRTAYAVMLPGAAILTGVALAQANWPQAALMSVFTGINISGLVRWRP